MGLLLYGAQHNVCETMPDIAHVANRPRVVETTVESAKEVMNLDFTAPTTNNVVVEEPKIEPQVTPAVESAVEEKVAIQHTPEVESVAHEESITTVDSAESAEPVQEEQKVEPKPEKPQKTKWTDRFRGFAERFRNKVDDMFTGDDFI